MKSHITVEQLRELVNMFMIFEQDPNEDSTEWAYACLEPALVECERITLDYLRQISKREFDALGENGYFEDILRRFPSVEILDVIEMRYLDFYGDNKNTDFYRENIAGLRNCIRSK